MAAANNAPPQWQAQGNVLNTFATRSGRPGLDFARLPDVQHLCSLPKAFEKDTPLPANPTPAQLRFHARWHICGRALPSASRGINLSLKMFKTHFIIYERWYSPPATRKG